MAKEKVTRAKVRDALIHSHGMKTGACEMLGISRPTLDRYLVKYPELLESLDFQKTRWKDRAEYKLHEAIERGESWAIMFTLKNAKDREYSDRLAIEGGERPIEFDYGKFINTATRPTGDSNPPGQDQSDLHGSEVGKDADSGSIGSGGE